MSVSNRLRKYCETNRITQISLVNKGFASAQTVNDYINGKTEPKANFLEKFINEFRVSAEWLMTGRGNYDEKALAINDSATKYGNCKDCEEKERTIQAQRKTIDTQERYIINLEEQAGKKLKQG